MQNTTPNADRFKYDIAFSFAGEDRRYVSQVANILASKGVKVFYDDFERVNLLGEDLYIYLQKVYLKESRYTIVFISEHYVSKLWTRHELRSALARAFREIGVYLLIARFDDTEVPGILDTIGYIDLRKVNAYELSTVLMEKLGVSREVISNNTDVARVLLKRPQTSEEAWIKFDVLLDKVKIGEVGRGETLEFETSVGKHGIKIMYDFEEEEWFEGGAVDYRYSAESEQEIFDLAPGANELICDYEKFATWKPLWPLPYKEKRSGKHKLYVRWR